MHGKVDLRVFHEKGCAKTVTLKKVWILWFCSIKIAVLYFLQVRR